MPKHYPPLWKSLPELSQWLGRNCSNCRYVTNLPQDGADALPCPLPQAALRSVVRQSATPTFVLGIVNPQQAITSLGNPARAPHSCGSRIDRRGRPKKT